MSRRRRTRFFIAVLVGGLWQTLPAPRAGALAATRVVTKTADTNDGVCDDDCSLREAVDVANSGDTITIPAGTFTLDSEIVIDEGLTLAGAGKEKTILQAAAAPGIAGHRLFDITVADENVTFRDLTLQNGAVIDPTGSGGAILWLTGTGDLSFFGCRVAFNEVDADGPVNGGAGSGGAIYYGASGTLSIVDSILADNQITANGGSGNGGAGSGGAISSSAASNVILRSALVRNRVLALGPVNNGAASGGAFFGAALILTDSTASGNGLFAGAASGGAFFNGPAEVSSSTIVDSQLRAGAKSGGGFFGIVTARNSILAHNEVSNCFGPFTSEGYNLIDIDCGVTPGPGDQIGTDTAPIDPLLGPLANNGGATLTHALRFGSPAIDAGNPTGCLDENAMALTVDQRNFPRVVDGNQDGTAICDIGALEQSAPTSPAPVLGWVGLLILSSGLAALGLRRAARAPTALRD
jgi:CSLREA domain-containing protein